MEDAAEEWMCQMTDLTKNRRIGDGTYGVVYSANFNSRPEEQVVVKRNLVEESTDFIGSVRELYLLLRLQGHPNVVRLLDVGFGKEFGSGPMSPVRTESDEEEDEKMRDDIVHFIFEKGSCDLHTWMYRTNKSVLQNLGFIRSAMAQLLIGLEFIHGRGIMHRDIKPGNILIFQEDQGFVFKYCDFGMSTPYTFQGKQSPKVVTSWYRSAEICRDSPEYDYSADIWSLGCVFVELFSRSALLYDTGEKSNVVLRKILRTVPFSAEDVDYALKKVVPESNLQSTFERSWLKPSNLESWLKILKISGPLVKSMSDQLGPIQNLIDLVQGMLRLDPRARLTAGQALAMPFFSEFQHEIQAMREQYPPVSVEDWPQVEALDCAERRWAMDCLAKVDIGRVNPRIVFQAADMFDRCLAHEKRKRDSDMEIESTAARPIETSEKGIYLTKKDAELWAYCSLYLSLKFFSATKSPPEFRSMLKGLRVQPALIKRYFAQAQDIEKRMVCDIFKGWIYRPTVYEAADRLPGKLSEHDVRNLLKLWLGPELPAMNGYSVLELVELYRKVTATA